MKKDCDMKLNPLQLKSNSFKLVIKSMFNLEMLNKLTFDKKRLVRPFRELKSVSMLYNGLLFIFK